MRVKIQTELQEADYKELVDFLESNPNVSVELFPGTDLKRVSVKPLTVVAEKSDYKIRTEIWFDQPIGLEIYDELRFSDEIRTNLVANRGNFRLSKTIKDPTMLGKYLNLFFKTTERIVNHILNMAGRLVETTFTLDSDWLAEQLDVILARQELKKRDETPRPFGTIHAQSSRRALERADALIPFYKEYDKTYLYDAKRVYYLLPHDFAANLLRCENGTMVREEDFDPRGKEVLKDLVYKKRLKKHETLDGITCYYGLNEKTRRYLRKHLKHKTSRF